MNNDILRTIITLLDPPSLIPFFNTHQIDFNLHFTYDAYKTRLRRKEFIYIFNHFPNIKLIGLGITKLKSTSQIQNSLLSLKKFYIHKLFTNFHELTPYNLTHIKFHISDNKSKSNPNLNLDLAPFNNHLRSLNLNYSEAINVTNIQLCTKLKSFKNMFSTPTNANNLTQCRNIKILKIGKCINLNAISTLTKLHTLTIDKCEELELPPMNTCTSLRKITLKAYTHITHINGLNKCSSLQHIHIDNCKKLQNVNGLKECSSLQIARITGCEQLKNIDGLHNLNLKYVCIKFCDKLNNINGLSECSSLQRIEMSFCKKMTNINALTTCINLRKIDLWHLDYLEDINNVIISCHMLQCIKIIKCRTAFRKTRDLINHKNLKTFYVNDSGKQKWFFSKECTNLENINVDKCNDHLINYVNCTSLKKLQIYNSSNLTSLSGLPNHKNLITLHLHDCSNLTNVKILNECTKLTHLSLSECKALTNLDMISHNTHLTHIDLSFCTQLKNIDGLSASAINLQELELTECTSLTTTSIAHILPKCINLRRLSLDKCTNIESLSDLSNCKLRAIQMSHCTNLNNISGLANCHYLQLVVLTNNPKLLDITPLFSCPQKFDIHVSEQMMEKFKNKSITFPKQCILHVSRND